MAIPACREAGGTKLGLQAASLAHNLAVSPVGQYPPFVPPGDLASVDSADWSKRQAALYLAWVQQQIVPRTDYLLGFLGVDPTLSHREILVEAGRAVQALLSDPSIMMASRGEEEILLLGRHAFVDSGPQLTSAGLGLTADMGLLTARMLLADHPGWQWEIGNGPRRAAWRNLPVLAVRGEQSLDPVLVSTSNAYGLARGDRPAGRTLTSDAWAELYDHCRAIDSGQPS